MKVSLILSKNSSVSNVGVVVVEENPGQPISGEYDNDRRIMTGH